MTGVVLEIVVILLLVVMNGLLAGSEIAVVASRRSRLRHNAEEGQRGAGAALELATSPNRFLSTVQIGITAVAVIAGAFGGARVARTLEPTLQGLGMAGAVAAQLAIVLVVLVITYVTLVIGELVPKRIALRDPEGVAAQVAPAMQRLSMLAAPIVRFLGVSTDAVLRLLRVEDRVEAEVTEEEIQGMIAHATETGVLEATEQQIVERLFRLSDTTVAGIMTPRDAIIWLDQNRPDEWPERLGTVRHSRYLVADGELDRFTGYVSVQELYHAALHGRKPDIAAMRRTAHVVPDWMPAFRILEIFQWSGDHFAVVRGLNDEVAGLVTLNDVLEGIVGQIPDSDDMPAPGIVQRADGSWLVDGLIPFDDFLRAFQRDAPEPRFPTLHAFVVHRLDAPPAATAAFHWNGLHLEIVDMDGSRVDKVLVTDQNESALPA
jgi:putative hemolysin